MLDSLRLASVFHLTILHIDHQTYRVIYNLLRYVIRTDHHLNNLGLIHNDFALRNICIDKYGNCHLIDFYGALFTREDIPDPEDNWLVYLDYDIMSVYGTEKGADVMTFLRS